MAPDVYGAPFEGPEKLLEVWFAPSAHAVPGADSARDGKFGLRSVPRAVWEEMLDIVKCKVLSVVQGIEVDAYLLSESSLFVSPHRLILKTCGTTLNLLGLPRILDIAAARANLTAVYRLFYSRKSFMFPERQQGPHRGWDEEVRFLDNIFANGSAYTVGRTNGDHWLLYMVGPQEDQGSSSASGSPSIPPRILSHNHHHHHLHAAPAIDAPPHPLHAGDCTIEILMTHLSPAARAPFFFGDAAEPSDAAPSAPFDQAHALQESIGITSLFPAHLTTLDAYAFSPCGYSSNALLKWGSAASSSSSTPNFDGTGGEGYYTIHVTPEEGWSYASFECNVPLPYRPSGSSAVDDAHAMPDLQTLVRRVVDIFQPGHITLTMFVSCADSATAEEEEDESAVEAAQRAFKAALTRPQSAGAQPRANEKREEPPASPSILTRFWSSLPLPFASADKSPAEPRAVAAPGIDIPVKEEVAGPSEVIAEEKAPASWGRLYRRTDKINYEFRGYDLAFASFELR
ncbi:S-adenosylmethionine decarboxylase [Punctularia strigosozonata HHB-11173 SS5]|uniref:S-adenosylmethionine decarboxylase n=1 Tax=Punctularia strigosozonata (strain HHB-11173) TaxID=741275 RepID=UPI00044169AE|nr:S-adenosylmethionine decarboxylase [Punctularia strigosozonata HHB-11173 SS5]EIN11371.1 S-adenosylmethionine decarboxylase [Punctularia strigosozonata HHB-11173 SS5]